MNKISPMSVVTTYFCVWNRLFVNQITDEAIKNLLILVEAGSIFGDTVYVESFTSDFDKARADFARLLPYARHVTDAFGMQRVALFYPVLVS